MPLSLADARSLAADVLRPGHFVSASPLAFAHADAETSRWEVFQGRLLDPAHTRQEATFETWSVFVGPTDGEPVLSLKLHAGGVLHVVRGVECFVHQAYSEGNVIQTREARRWVRELVATFALADFDAPDDLRDEMVAALARAVTGTRLPLTPTEAPLPAFTFGRLFYSAVAETGPNDPRSLEFWLRSDASDPIDLRYGDLATGWMNKGGSNESLLADLRRIFDDVSLSPWTGLVAKIVRLLGLLERCHFLTPAAVIDFESSLLRLVCRHLTAYDLVAFHHRGANYPDALLLDAVLADYLVRINAEPDLFAGKPGRVRRRALRQAYLLRGQYENHPVPDVPTSPGEHQRVLPDGHPRVPEDQILNPAARTRRLFADDPLLARLSPASLDVLRQSVADLGHPDERRELGAAVFLDRPFGAAKRPVEPDATPLLASLAYSRFVALQRVRRLCQDLNVTDDHVGDLTMAGLSLDRIGAPSRPGTVSLADAARAAPDFEFLRTLGGGVRALGEWIDFGAFAPRFRAGVLLVRSAHGPGVVAYDDRMTAFAEIVPDYSRGYRSRRGIEFPAAGALVCETPRDVRES